MISSDNGQPMKEAQEALKQHVQREGRLKHLATLRALDWMHDSQRRQAEIEQAENNWYMDQMGQNPDEVAARVDMDGHTNNKNLGGGESGSDKMRGNTILGDIHYPAPVVVQQSPPPSSTGASPLLPMVLLSLLTGGLPVAGMAGYMLASAAKKLPQAVEQKFDDETIEIGLGKIEDYFSNSAEKKE